VVKDCAAKVHKKYPGAYNDLDDETLVKTLLAKYPHLLRWTRMTLLGGSPKLVHGCIEQEHAKVHRRGRVPLSGAAGRLRQWHTEITAVVWHMSDPISL